MTSLALNDVLKLAGTWPEDAQEELAEIAADIDVRLRGGDYQALPEELAGIDRGLAAARDDLVGILAYAAREYPQAHDGLVRRIKLIEMRISMWPDSGRRFPERGGVRVVALVH